MKLLVWNKENSIEDVIKKDKIVILEFGSEVCGACKSINYKLSNWIEEREGIVGYYIPVEDNMELAAELGIFSSPVVMVYVEGALTIREAGYFGLEQILKDILRYKNLLEDK